MQTKRKFLVSNGIVYCGVELTVEKNGITYRDLAIRCANKLKLITGDGYYFEVRMNDIYITNLDEVINPDFTSPNCSFCIYSIAISKRKKMITFKKGEIIFKKEVSLEDIYFLMGKEYYIKIRSEIYSNDNAYMPLTEGPIYEFIKK